MPKLKSYYNKIVEIIRKHPLLSSAIITGVFTTVILCVCDIRYDVNDDMVMANIVQGGYGKPDPHTVFINILLGYILSGLASVMPIIPWYPVVMYICLVSSLVAIGFLLCKKISNNLLSVGFFVLFLLIFGANLLMSPQFTKTAGILACTGIFLVVDSTNRGKICKGEFVAALLFVSFGVLYRQDMAFLCIAVTMTYLLYYITKGKFEIKKVLTAVASVAVCVAVGGILMFAGSRIYLSDPAWAKYEVFQDDRSILFDFYFFDYGLFSEVCDANGLSEENVQYYLSTNDFADTDIFTMEAAHELAMARSEIKVFDEFPVKEFLKKVMPGGMLKNYGWFALSIATAVMLILLDRRQFIWALINAIGITAIEAWLFWNLRFLIERVDISIVLTAVLSALLIGADYSVKKPKNDVEAKGKKGLYVYSLLTSVLALILVAVGLVHFGKEIGDNRDKSAKRTESFSEAAEVCNMVANDKEHLYIRSVMCDNPWECAYDIWRNSQKGSLENVLPLGDWLTYSPITEIIKENYGISNPYRDIIDNDKVYLLSIDANPGRMEEYIERNYNSEAKIKLLKEEGKAKIYRVFTE